MVLPIWEQHSNDIDLSDNQLHIWRASLAIDETEQQKLFKLLTPKEQSRAQRFMFAKHTRRYTASTGYLRIILSYYLGIAPEEIEFSYGERGKPYITDSPFEFNMSNSDEYFIMGISKNIVLGIDIEKWRDRTDIEGLVKHSFSELEQREFSTIAAQDKRASFYQGWTTNEAYIKAIGQGLYHDLTKFSVQMDINKPPNILLIEDEKYANKNWRTLKIEMEKELTSTLVYESESEPTTKYFQL